MVKRQNPKRVTLPNGRTFLARYRLQRVQNYRQMCISRDHTDRQRLREDEDVESDKVGEVLKVHLKKLSILLKKSVKTKL